VLEISSLKVTLISGRSLGQGRSKVIGKFSEQYLRDVAVCELDPEDMKILGISAGQNVKVTTKTGSVIVRSALASQITGRGVVFMPYGFWVNMLISAETFGTGMPSMKGIEAEVAAAPDEKVIDLRSLVGNLSRGE
jgi:formylmethanofuran dehydrogenase subunit D